MQGKFLIIVERDDKEYHNYFSSKKELLEEVDFLNKRNKINKIKGYGLYKINFAGRIEDEVTYY